MLETHLSAASTQRRLRSGPASTHIDEFADWLHARGYKRWTLVKLLQSLAGWTDWLNETGKAGERLQDGLRRCEEYVKSLPRVRYRFGPNSNSLRAARIFLQFLRERGLIPPGAETPSADLRCALLGEFRTWMIEHHGVTETTLDVYQRALEDFVNAAGSEPRAYKPEVLRSFVLQRGIASRRFAHKVRTHCPPQLPSFPWSNRAVRSGARSCSTGLYFTESLIDTSFSCLRGRRSHHCLMLD